MKLFNSFLLAALMAISSAALADRTAGEAVDDSTLQTRVKSSLVGDDFFGGMGINTEVYHGVVQISGFVDSDEVRDRADEAVKGVEGVTDFRNRLYVQGEKQSMGQKIDDGVIASTTKSRIAGDDNVSSVNILVDSRNGVVLLAGFAKTAEEKARAGEIASGVDNVVDVINGIDVVE